jgi:hypothetical protein
MAISLSSISRTKHATPPRIIIFGPEKCGKSTFFAGGYVNGQHQDGAPKPIFIRTEDGLNGLDVDAFPLAETYQQVTEAIGALITETHDYQTVVIDSADWLERLIHQHVINSCTNDVRGIKTMESAHGGYGKAYSVALSYWREILAGLDMLNRQKGMVVGIICHSTVVTVNDPFLPEPIDKWETKLHKPSKGTGARDLISEWADVIGFAQREAFVARKTTADGKQIVRGSSPIGTSNKLHLVGSPGVVAGNRYSLPPTIDLSWQAFSDALAAAMPQPVQQPIKAAKAA